MTAILSLILVFSLLSLKRSNVLPTLATGRPAATEEVSESVPEPLSDASEMAERGREAEGPRLGEEGGSSSSVLERFGEAARAGAYEEV